jgi:hypothetical protein
VFPAREVFAIEKLFPLVGVAGAGVLLGGEGERSHAER